MIHFCQENSLCFLFFPTFAISIVNMPKKIDHEERKIKILKTALDVFAKEGYRDSNLSLIAEECGLSRPTIYQYFKDKNEIFYYAVKLVTGIMFQRYGVIAWDSSYGDCLQRIEYICNDIIDEAVRNEGALQSLMDVMLQSKRDNIDFSQIIVKRTIKLTILFKRLLNAAIKEGEIPYCDVNKVSNHLFTLLEAFCFQIAFLGNFSASDSKDFIATYLGGYRKN